MSYIFKSSGIVGKLDHCVDNIEKQMNANLKKIDQLLPRSIISFVAFLPVSPSAGDAYILDSDGSINVFDDGSWSTYSPKVGYSYVDQTEKELIIYNGTGWDKYQLTATGTPVANSGSNINTSGVGVFDNNNDGSLEFRGLKGLDGISEAYNSTTKSIEIRTNFKFGVYENDSAAQSAFESLDFKGSSLSAGDKGFYYYYNSLDDEFKVWNGAEFTLLSGSGGGGSTINFFEPEDTSAFKRVDPLTTMETFVFTDEDASIAALKAVYKIPNGHKEGTQINLRFPFYSPDDNSGNSVSWSLTTSIIKNGVDSAAAPSDSHVKTQSINNLATSYIINTSNIEILDSLGNVGSTLAQANDTLILELKRNVDTTPYDVDMVNATEVYNV